MLQPGRRARAEIFVDREPVFALYRSELARSVSEPRILNITGIGGIGKSRLLTELRKEEHTGTGVRSAVVDFEAPGLRQRDPVLLHLREQFHRQNVRFDRFDIAYAVLWQRLHPHLRINERDLPLARESEILSQMLADVAQLPMIAGAVGLLRLADRLRMDVRRRYRIRNDETLQRLDELSEPGRLGELARTVGELFVAELCEASLGGTFVIFMDCYESLVPEPLRTGRVGATDAWLRELLGPLTHGLVVVAGREPLAWTRHKDAWRWTERTADHRLPGLPLWARSAFLTAAGIGDEQARSAIAEESDGLPFYLQLAADTGGTGTGGRSPGAVPTDAILNRFLHHVGPEAEAALQLLGVARIFDFPVFRTLTQRFYLPSHRLAWDNLRSYSFVQPTESGLLRLHHVMAAALSAGLSSEQAQDIHACLADTWAARVDGDAAAGSQRVPRLVALGEAVFHGLHAGTLSAETILRHSDRAILIGGKQAGLGILSDLQSFLTTLPAGAPFEELSALARCLHGETAILVGDVDQALRLSEEPGPDPATLIGARLAVVRGDALRIAGRTGEVLRLYTDVWQRHRGSARLKAGLSAADLHMCQGRFTQADDLAARIEAECGSDGHETRGDVARLRHLAARMMFDFTASAAWLRRAQREYEDAEAFVGLANIRTNLLEQYAFTRPDRALAMADGVITFHREAGTLHELGKAWTAFGIAQLRQGELDSAQTSFMEARQVLVRAGYRSGHARAELFHGALLARRGEVRAADAMTREAVRVLAESAVYPTLILMAGMLLERIGTSDAVSGHERERAQAAIMAADPLATVTARVSDALTELIG